MKYNETVTRTQNDMEKSQSTVKILDMKIDSTNKTGQIDNASLLRDTIRKNLKDIFKIPADLLLGTLIQITSKTLKNGSAPVAIIANTKDTKIARVLQVVQDRGEFFKFFKKDDILQVVYDR